MDWLIVFGVAVVAIGAVHLHLSCNKKKNDWVTYDDADEWREHNKWIDR